MDYRILFIGVVFASQCFEVESSRNLGSVIEIGRSIAGFISSGISDFSEIRKNMISTSSKNEQILSSNDRFISIDDLFNGLSDVWSNKNSNVSNSNEPQSYDPKDEDSNCNNDNNDAEADKLMSDGREDDPDETEGLIYEPQNFNEIVIRDIVNKSEIVRVEPDDEEGTKNHWMRIKVVIENMKSLFREAFGEDSNEKLEIINMIDKMLTIGDKINLIKNIEDSFDKDLLQFLYEKWINAQDLVLNDNLLLKTMLSIDGKVLLLTIAKGLVKQFSKAFHQQALAHVQEQDFIIDTMRLSGFDDSEIYEVFRLLDLPTKPLVETSKTLKFDQFKGRSLINFGGLFGKGGGYGGGHHGGGYGSVMKKDPLLLLAGLAFATFAAYLLYRLLSSTPSLVKRGFQDISISLYLSDIPRVMTNVYQWLESTEERYGTPEEELSETSIDSFVNSINNLWKSFQVDKTSMACVRRYLCHYVQENPYRSLRYGTSLLQLALLGLAELFGAQELGKANDFYVQKLMNGETTNCATDAPKCSDRQFSVVIKSQENKKHHN